MQAFKPTPPGPAVEVSDTDSEGGKGAAAKMRRAGAGQPAADAAAVERLTLAAKAHILPAKAALSSSSTSTQEQQAKVILRKQLEQKQLELQALRGRLMRRQLELGSGGNQSQSSETLAPKRGIVDANLPPPPLGVLSAAVGASFASIAPPLEVQRPRLSTAVAAPQKSAAVPAVSSGVWDLRKSSTSDGRTAAPHSEADVVLVNIRENSSPDEAITPPSTSSKRRQPVSPELAPNNAKDVTGAPIRPALALASKLHSERLIEQKQRLKKLMEKRRGAAVAEDFADLEEGQEVSSVIDLS